VIKVVKLSVLLYLSWLLTIIPISANGFELKSKCITLQVVSLYPLAYPTQIIEGRYIINYKNICSFDVPSVEIALVERDGYDYRVLSGGGRLGRVTADSIGSISITLSYSTFSQVQSTIYLYVKESYPLESRSLISL